jgi:hypothetical protein
VVSGVVGRVGRWGRWIGGGQGFDRGVICLGVG